MNRSRLRTVARRLAAAPPRASGPPAADAALLSRFLDAHDEDAAGVLVARHLPAVRAVCRSVLRDPHDADDAAQATFLVLVRRAGAVRDRQALGGWLCRVAWRTANRLREQNARRVARREPGVEPDTTPAAIEAAPAGDVRAALDEEIARLPEQYRAAVLTCYAAGVSTADAAARLGWPKGTLLTRLAWARKRLRDRLTQRGVTLAGGFTAAFAGRAEVAGSAVFAGRVGDAMTAVLAGGPPAGMVSDRVSSLTEGVVRHMVGTKLKVWVGAGFAAVAVLGLGLGRMTAGADPGDNKRPAGVGGGAQVGAGVGAEKPARPERPAPVLQPPAVREEVAPPAADGPGEEVVRVRRPRGSYTREVQPFGRGTITFAEKRLHVVADIRIEQAAFTVTIDGDYSINPDGIVYGVVTCADITGVGLGEEAGELAFMASAATDTPFAFRCRTDDDAVSIRDIKFGPFGASPLFGGAFGGGDGVKEVMMVMGMIGGKYKADPNPDRNRPLTAPGGPAPRLRRQQQNMSYADPTIGPPPGQPVVPGQVVPGPPALFPAPAGLPASY